MRQSFFVSRETGKPVASLDPRPEEPPATRTLRAKIRDCVVRYEKGWSDIQEQQPLSLEQLEAEPQEYACAS